MVTEASRLHFADGKALITLAPDDFENAGVETAMHEASHAVFESHSHPDAKHPEALAPDTFALRFTDLYLRLAKTKAVAVPEKPFRKKKPGLRRQGRRRGAPGGLRDGHRRAVERRRGHRRPPSGTGRTSSSPAPTGPTCTTRSCSAS